MRLTQYGERKLGGAGDLVAQLIMDWEKKEKKLSRIVYPNVGQNSHDYPIEEEAEVRNQTPGYEVRMGGPSEYDLCLAELLAYHGVKKIIEENKFETFPTLKEVLTLSELKEVLTGEKAHQWINLISLEEAKPQLVPVAEYYDTENLTSTPAFDDFIHKILGQELSFVPFWD